MRSTDGGMGVVGDRTKKRGASSTDTNRTNLMLQRIERSASASASACDFDPQALIALLEREEEEDQVQDDASFISESLSYATSNSNGQNMPSVSGEQCGDDSGAAGRGRQRQQQQQHPIPDNGCGCRRINLNPDKIGSRSASAASFHSSSASASASALPRSIAWTAEIIASATLTAKKQIWRNREYILKRTAVSVLLLCFCNMSMSLLSLRIFREFNAGPGQAISSSELTGKKSMQNRLWGGNDDIPFVMCDRETPFRISHNKAANRPLHKVQHDWPKENKILLLRNDGKFGQIGNQFNSLLHAFDYARDHNLHLGMLFHSWAMDVIHTMFYETDDFDKLGEEMMNDLGILIVRNQTQLALYDEVVSQNAQQLFFYKSSNKNMDHWRETMVVHKSIMQQLFFRYNRGYGYIHNGLRAQDVCGALDMFFKERVRDVKYSVIHTQFSDENAVWKFNQIAKATGITVEGGAITMSPAYVKSILKPLGMLEYPIILITDGKLAGVERGLSNDPIIGPRLMVLSDRVALDGADVALAVLSDVFIGNPASVTSGLIARARMSLGFSYMSTQLFRRKRIHQWYSVCNEECVFNPWILSHV